MFISILLKSKLLKLLEVLEDVKPDVDFKSSKCLIDDRILDSLDIVSIVSALNEEFDIQISIKDIVPENFNSVDALYSLVKRLQED